MIKGLKKKISFCQLIGQNLRSMGFSYMKKKHGQIESLKVYVSYYCTNITKISLSKIILLHKHKKISLSKRNTSKINNKTILSSKENMMYTTITTLS